MIFGFKSLSRACCHQYLFRPVPQIANLPKYTQLRFNVTATYPGSATVQALGQSNLFALTDVATAGFLSTLYNIPKGISVQHGSNQSVVEFYGEVSVRTQNFMSV